MAGTPGSSSDAVAFFTKLEQEAHHVDFFQALRKLEALHMDKPGLGRSSRPADDPARLCQEPSLKFAPSTLSGFELGKDGGPPRLATYFFGLFGPNGPLPTHLTEHALQRTLNFDDPTFARFADMFHHRMLSLLYRAWADARPTVQFDRPNADRFSTYVGALFGIGSEELKGADELGSTAKLHYAGVLSLQTRNAEGLRALINDYFGVSAEIVEFAGGWMQLPENCLLRLGADRESGLLGINAVTGAEVWGGQQKFRISMGPMKLSELKRMLPGGESLKRLVAIVRSYVGDEKDWDLNLLLDGTDAPALSLGESGELGWTTWLGSNRDRPVILDDVVLQPMHAVTEFG
jgi:type VI secretion system protein ImpH